MPDECKTLEFTSKPQRKPFVTAWLAYYPAENEPLPSGPIAALVTGITDGGNLRVTIFPPGSDPLPLARPVPFESAPAPGCCNWHS
jgi:hypothetical protein